MQQAVATTAVARRVSVWYKIGKCVGQQKASDFRSAKIHCKEKGREPSGSRCRHALIRGINPTYEETAQRCINSKTNKHANAHARRSI
eukprot:6181669-Pleurochrysis_carterae.AAC.4